MVASESKQVSLTDCAARRSRCPIAGVSGDFGVNDADDFNHTIDTNKVNGVNEASSVIYA